MKLKEKILWIMTGIMAIVTTLIGLFSLRNHKTKTSEPILPVDDTVDVVPTIPFYVSKEKKDEDLAKDNGHVLGDLLGEFNPERRKP